MDTLTVDDLTFAVRRSPRRRSLEIVVERDGSLVIVAPEGHDEELLAEFVLEKRFWIYSKLAARPVSTQSPPSKEFVTGEGFSYLGRSYRLLVVGKQEVPLKLEHGRFKLRRGDVAQGRATFVRWYTDHAKAWLDRRIQIWSQRLGVESTGVDVRDLGFRWGSCGKNGRIYVHWRTILLPPQAVDYVLVHELAHLLEAWHTPAFWLRVERALPDYVQRKEWLAANGQTVGV